MNSSPRLLITGASGFIGANAVDYFTSRGYEVRGTDCDPPKRPEHQKLFVPCDLLDAPKLAGLFRDFSPEYLLHLGAVTDTFSRSRLEEYAPNIEGVRNVIAAANACAELRRMIVTSSRLVCRIGYQPKSETDYAPPNAYGESKVETERITRASEIRAEWVLTRPTAIWGPGFLVPSYRDFFEHIRRQRYFHLGRENPSKTFGYVKNFVFQMEKLLLAPRDLVQGRMFYIGDYEPVKLREWAEMIQREFGCRRIKTVPMPMVRWVAVFGDLLHRLGMPNPPLTSYRLANMLSDSVHEPGGLEAITGDLPYDLETATRETVTWLKANP